MSQKPISRKPSNSAYSIRHEYAGQSVPREGSKQIRQRILLINEPKPEPKPEPEPERDSSIEN